LLARRRLRLSADRTSRCAADGRYGRVTGGLPAVSRSRRNASPSSTRTGQRTTAPEPRRRHRTLIDVPVEQVSVGCVDLRSPLRPRRSRKPAGSRGAHRHRRPDRQLACCPGLRVYVDYARKGSCSSRRGDDRGAGASARRRPSARSARCEAEGRGASARSRREAQRECEARCEVRGRGARCEGRGEGARCRCG
jgi:hypothetical protein